MLITDYLDDFASGKNKERFCDSVKNVAFNRHSKICVSFTYHFIWIQPSHTHMCPVWQDQTLTWGGGGTESTKQEEGGCGILKLVLLCGQPPPWYATTRNWVKNNFNILMMVNLWKISLSNIENRFFLPIKISIK